MVLRTLPSNQRHPDSPESTTTTDRRKGSYLFIATMSAEVMHRAGVNLEDSEVTESEDVRREEATTSIGLVKERFLAKGSDLVPSGDESNDLKLDIEHTKRCILAREETIRIVMPTHEPYAGGAYFKENRKLFFGPTTITLHDKNDSPVALCLQENNAFTICGSRSIVDLDAPLLLEGEQGWYRWYEVRKMRQGVTNYYPIFVWDGMEFKHFLRAVPMEKKFREHGPTEKCDIVIEAQEEEVKFARFTKKTFAEEYKKEAVDGWHLCIDPGVDPAAMLCFAVALDKMIVKLDHV